MGKKAPMLEIPSSDNQFLSDYLFAIKKRRKSLVYKSSSIKCERLLVDHNGKRFEKVEFTLNPY
jgi:hypothetical protein